MVKFGVPRVGKISTYNIKNSELGGEARAPTLDPPLWICIHRFFGRVRLLFK